MYERFRGLPYIQNRGQSFYQIQSWYFCVVDIFWWFLCKNNDIASAPMSVARSLTCSTWQGWEKPKVRDKNDDNVNNPTIHFGKFKQKARKKVYFHANNYSLHMPTVFYEKKKTQQDNSCKRKRNMNYNISV